MFSQSFDNSIIGSPIGFKSGCLAVNELEKQCRSEKDKKETFNDIILQYMRNACLKRSASESNIESTIVYIFRSYQSTAASEGASSPEDIAKVLNENSYLSKKAIEGIINALQLASSESDKILVSYYHCLFVNYSHIKSVVHLYFRP